MTIERKTPRSTPDVPFVILDKERRQLLEQFETREQAEARVAELLAEDPDAEDLLVVESYGEPR